jgi:hypothetical protein
MPKPIYIICSEGGAEDKTTGLVSHFNVLETIELIVEQDDSQGGDAIPAVNYRIQTVAVWGRSPEDDPETWYESEVCLHIPPEGKEIFGGKHVFRFEKTRFRVTANLQSLPVIGSGVLRIEHRIRPSGDESAEWLSQSYEISLNVSRQA